MIEILEEQTQATEALALMWERVGRLCLQTEGVDPDQYSVSLTLTDNENIRIINREQRRIDRATDVLSFPSVTYPEGKTCKDIPERFKKEYDPQTGLYALGDLVISLERAGEQAEEYGHSLMREAGFLLIHGILHLMGYDHIREEDRMVMRSMEEKILEKSGLSREYTDEQLECMEQARAVSQKAYAPYSGYHVGACLRAEDGAVYTGCNVENASYGLTICAERSAVFSAVAHDVRRIRDIAIYAKDMLPLPCGACRQVMREFAEGTMEVIIFNDEKVLVTTLEQLLPESFIPFMSEVKK